MQFTFIKLVTLVVAAQGSIWMANAAPATDTTLLVAGETVAGTSPLDFNVGKFCTDSNLSGTCAAINVDAIPSSCFTVIAQFNDQISSIQIDSGITCSFFIDAGCKGNVAGGITGTINDLGTAGGGFNDAISAYSCQVVFQRTIVGDQVVL
ncbi:hypothetical protein C8J56DRAFT_1052009 [Mycena floridula]|nr:hypothetical protein C8J56DRAFT_1085195 [Mycena floridula]KAJ7586663.1 hypothetical protein C8J56DRAFT_1052009 [Mycena floridula]